MPAEEQAVPGAEPPKPSQVRFHYLKSNYYRTIHANGAFGGITPRGEIAMQLYSERFPLPDTTTHVVNPDRSLGGEIVRERQTRDGILRELEVGAVFDLDTAREIADWLLQQITRLEALSADENHVGDEST